MTSPGLDLLHVDAALACARWGGVVIVVWRGEPTRERLEQCFAAFARGAERAGGSAALLALIEEGSPPPALPDLPVAARAWDDLPVMLGTCVLEGKEPWFSFVFEAAVRMLSLRRGGQPTKLCTDVGEAATWLATRVPHAGESDAVFRARLVDAVETLRATMP